MSPPIRVREHQLTSGENCGGAHAKQIEKCLVIASHPPFWQPMFRKFRTQNFDTARNPSHKFHIVHVTKWPVGQAIAVYLHSNSFFEGRGMKKIRNNDSIKPAPIPLSLRCTQQHVKQTNPTWWFWVHPTIPSSEFNYGASLVDWLTTQKTGSPAQLCAACKVHYITSPPTKLVLPMTPTCWTLHDFPSIFLRWWEQLNNLIHQLNATF